MSCDDIKVCFSFPISIGEPNRNGVTYTEGAIRKACENASGLPLIQFNEQGKEVPIGITTNVKYSNGFILVEASIWRGGTRL